MRFGGAILGLLLTAALPPGSHGFSSSSSTATPSNSTLSTSHQFKSSPVGVVRSSHIPSKAPPLSHPSRNAPITTHSHRFALRPSRSRVETKINLQSDTAVGDGNPAITRNASYAMIQAGLLGCITGWAVGLFKLAIEALGHYIYHKSLFAQTKVRFARALIPAVGGILVGLLGLMGQFPPGLRGTIEDVDEMAFTQQTDSLVEGLRGQFRSLRKSLASVCTLGTGCSLGPEGPSVEIGMNLSRILMVVFPRYRNNPIDIVRHNRLLLACGAAAGVSAGFNAPIAGVFFALEIMQKAFTELQDKNPKLGSNSAPSLLSMQGSISSVLIASVLSALVARSLVGEHLHLTLNKFSMATPLMETPLYMLLGVTSGLVAFSFSHVAKWSQSLFSGTLGPKGIRRRFKKMPGAVKPMIGGLFCGLVGLVFPQVLFNGYDTINGLLANNPLKIPMLLSLLAVKTTTTAVAAGSGLVGGTFAPSLFLGAMTGGAFHGLFGSLLEQQSHAGVMLSMATLNLAEIPVYTMMGAASCLAALFKAPLTAVLLAFELTREYSCILPLMIACGVSSLTDDILEYRQEFSKKRDHDAVSWGDLSDDQVLAFDGETEATLSAGQLVL